MGRCCPPRKVELRVSRGNCFNWGDLARRSPVSDVWGTDRGLPVDRFFIHQFLDLHRTDIRGRVLEVKDPGYTRMFGGKQVLDAQVIDLDGRNPEATLVADLSSAGAIAADQFDCFILTQTLHIIYDIHAALALAVRMLKPQGVLLCTIPAVSRVNYEDGGLETGDYWRLTGAAEHRLFCEVLPADGFTIQTSGNVKVCAAFLFGLAAEDLSVEDLKFNDPWFPLVHCVRAVKPPRSRVLQEPPAT